MDDREGESRVLSLLTVRHRLDYAEGAEAYIDRRIHVPAGVTSLTVTLTYEKVTDRFQLYAAVFDPSGEFRGHVQCPGPPGPRALRFVVGEREASPGCVAGPVISGEWTLRIDLDRFRESGEYEIVVHGQRGHEEEMAGPLDLLDANSAARRLLTQGSGSGGSAQWLKGELHSHSVHSDGRDPVPKMLADVQASGLDFWALSDHFTWSHWRELAEHVERGTTGNLLVLPSVEVTTHEGHGNVHGCLSWPDVYVDRSGWTAGDLARAVHEDSALIGINHPFSGPQAWRRSDLPWDQVDLMEVVNHGQFANNDAAIALWDRLLASGHDIAPVAGTDCHSVDDPEQAIGQLVTYVRAEERSVAGVLEALRQRRTVVSRGTFLDLALHGAFGAAGLGSEVEVPAGDTISLVIDVDAQHAGSLFILRDGLLWHQRDLEPGQHHLTIEDRLPVTGAYRAEFHRRSTDARYWASCFRSHESFEALTSFIRVVTV